MDRRGLLFGLSLVGAVAFAGNAAARSPGAIARERIRSITGFVPSQLEVTRKGSGIFVAKGAIAPGLGVTVTMRKSGGQTRVGNIDFVGGRPAIVAKDTTRKAAVRRAILSVLRKGFPGESVRLLKPERGLNRGNNLYYTLHTNTGRVVNIKGASVRSGDGYGVALDFVAGRLEK